MTTRTQGLPITSGPRRGLPPRWRPLRPERSGLILLTIVVVFSVGSRALWLDRPKAMVFDEIYYVNAARTILRLPVPAGAPFEHATPGVDPVREHPPLATLAIAAGIKVFGDGPVGWRAGAVLFGTLAIVAMYGLVRSARGSPLAAVGAAALMAVDNLFVVHGRIATLDIFVVAFMILGAALYLRERPVLAGLAVGLGMCAKLVGLLVLVALALFELVRARWPPEAADATAPARVVDSTRLRSLAICAAAAVVTYLGVLAVIDSRIGTSANPVDHTLYMLRYANSLTTTSSRFLTGPTSGTLAPTSKPWQWLVNQVPVRYYSEPAAPPAPGGGNRPRILFQGRMNPFIILLAVPALALAARGARGERDQVSQLAVAWCAGTYLPLVALGLNYRVSYIFYMLLVLPGVYLALARILTNPRLPPAALIVYGSLLAVGFVNLYPFRTWAGR